MNDNNYAIYDLSPRFNPAPVFYIPRHWMLEPLTDPIHGAMTVYLAGEELTEAQETTIRGYLSRWVEGEDIHLDPQESITGWIEKATAAGMCPL